jgi:hypothetical protein
MGILNLKQVSSFVMDDYHYSKDLVSPEEKHQRDMVQKKMDQTMDKFFSKRQTSDKRNINRV